MWRQMPGYYKQGIGCADRGMKAIEQKVAGMLMKPISTLPLLIMSLRN